MMYYFVYRTESTGLIIEEYETRESVMQGAEKLFIKYDNDPSFEGVYLFKGSVLKLDLPPKQKGK